MAKKKKKTKKKSKYVIERFTADVLFEVVDEPENHPEWLVGYAAAKAGKARLESKPIYWLYGYDQYFAEQL